MVELLGALHAGVLGLAGVFLRREVAHYEVVVGVLLLFMGCL